MAVRIQLCWDASGPAFRRACSLYGCLLDLILALDGMFEALALFA